MTATSVSVLRRSDLSVAHRPDIFVLCLEWNRAHDRRELRQTRRKSKVCWYIR